MFGGREELVTIEAKDYLAGSVIDRFGVSNTFIRSDFGFRFSVRVMVSKTFFAWITGFGEDMKIIEPLSVKEEMKNFLKSVIKNYK